MLVWASYGCPLSRKYYWPWFNSYSSMIYHFLNPFDGQLSSPKEIPLHPVWHPWHMWCLHLWINWEDTERNSVSPQWKNKRYDDRCMSAVGNIFLSLCKSCCLKLSVEGERDSTNCKTFNSSWCSVRWKCWKNSDWTLRFLPPKTVVTLLSTAAVHPLGKPMWLSGAPVSCGVKLSAHPFPVSVQILPSRMAFLSISALAALPIKWMTQQKVIRGCSSETGWEWGTDCSLLRTPAAGNQSKATPIIFIYIFVCL